MRNWRKQRCVEDGEARQLWLPTLSFVRSFGAHIPVRPDVCIYERSKRPGPFWVATYSNTARPTQEVGPFTTPEEAALAAQAMLLINEAPWGKVYET